MSRHPLYRPRHWEGVPGVRYPEEVAAAASAVPEGWLPTAEAARALHMSCPTALRVLRRAGVAARRVAGGGLVWEPLGVARAGASTPCVVRELPQGWCTAASVCRRLGFSRSTLERRREGLPVTTMRVIYRGRLHVLYDAGQVQRLAALRSMP